MTPLTREQARRLAATERRWLAESADRLRRPIHARPSIATRTSAREAR